MKGSTLVEAAINKRSRQEEAFLKGLRPTTIGDDHVVVDSTSASCSRLSPTHTHTHTHTMAHAHTDCARYEQKRLCQFGGHESGHRRFVQCSMCEVTRAKIGTRETNAISLLLCPSKSLLRSGGKMVASSLRRDSRVVPKNVSGHVEVEEK